MSVQPSHLRNPDRTANHASPSAPLAIRETRSASPPVSQINRCCISFGSLAFVVLPLIANAPLDDASRAFNDIEHGFFAILAVRGFVSLLYIRPHFQQPTVAVVRT